MGIVTVAGLIPIAQKVDEDTYATFKLCDRYGNIYYGYDVTTEVQPNKYFVTELLDTGDDRAYSVLTDEGKKIFEVHRKNDGSTYYVDLCSTNTHRPFLSTLDDAYDNDVLANIEDIIRRYNAGEDIFTTDEKEIIFALLADDNQDKRISQIKINLENTIQINNNLSIPTGGECQTIMTLYLDEGNTASGVINFPFVNAGTLIFKNTAHDLSSYVSITRNASTMQGVYSIPASLATPALNGIYDLGFDNAGVIETSSIRIEVCS